MELFLPVSDEDVEDEGGVRLKKSAKDRAGQELDEPALSTDIKGTFVRLNRRWRRKRTIHGISYLFKAFNYLFHQFIVI